VSHWVVQSELDGEPGWTGVLPTLERFAIPYSVHRVVPLIGELIPEPELQTDEVVCIGSYSMRHAARRNGWNPGVFDLAPHGFREQLRHWGEHMLNADSAIVALQDVVFVGARFVRPVEDTKVFTGRVFEAEEFADWRARMLAPDAGHRGTLRAETEVQISAPKDVYQEVRCWVVEGRVVTASTYKIGAVVTYTDRVDERFLEFAAELVDPQDGWNPEKAFCIDVCETRRGLKIVEINTINSSAFYAADMQKLVHSLDGLRR
jgi:ATP-grasp domain, R2K clade family 3